MGTALMTRDQLKAGLARVKRSTSAFRSGGDTPFLNISRHDGSITFGQAKTPVEEGSFWAVNPASFRHGWIAWHRGAIEHEEMVPMSKDLPDESTLPEVKAKNGYEMQVSVDLRGWEGDHAGVTVQLKKATKGTLDFVDDLIEDIDAQTGDAFIPVIELQVESYQHAEYGLIFKPTYTVVRWVTPAEGEEQAAKVEAGTVEAEKPVNRAKTETQAEAEEAEESKDEAPAEEPKPRRRRVIRR